VIENPPQRSICRKPQIRPIWTTTIWTTTIRTVIGHASIAITADVYGHLIGTIAQKAVDGAANLIAHTVHTHQEVDA
jgi:cellulase/cellobiase CelA1